MKASAILIILFCVVILLAVRAAEPPEMKDPCSYVDPFIGTAGDITHGFGNTYPGAAYPFGMIQLSPANGGSGWQYASGYHYEDSLIAGFSHLNLNGTGVGDLNDILVMPSSKEIREEYFIQPRSFVDTFLKTHPLPWYDVDEEEGEIAGFRNNLLLKYRSKFSHQQEKASPGYYSVRLPDDDITAEFTVSEFTGMHRYTFNNKTGNQHLILDLGFQVGKGKPEDTFFESRANDLVVGYRFTEGWAKNHRVYFAMRFSRPFINCRSFLAENNVSGKGYRGKNLKGVFTFDNQENNVLLVKVAISPVSAESALANLRTADCYHFDFDKMHDDTRKKWNFELGKIDLTDSNIDRKRIFYTSLYHCLLTPYRYSDVNGFYKGYNNQPVKASGYVHYTVLSLWDTFRGLDPLLTIIQPALYNNIIHSMLSQYLQTGSLPYWEIMGSEGGSMIGYHAVSLIADAILKGIGDFDKNLAYEAMVAASETDRNGLGFYQQYGFVPTDKEKNGTVSKTVEYCYDDWCIAQVAKHMGKTEDYRKYMIRSAFYKNLFDPAYQLMRGRESNGTWYEPFHPRFSEFGNKHFVEGNSWHYSFFVPHDIGGLMELMGGKKGLERMLDSLFCQTSEQLGRWTDDVTGLIGQYSHGNEPSHHVAYLYNYAGNSRKTQFRVNQILDSLYTVKPDGLCGNEDCGQLSAWYVLSSLGFYPVNPASGIYDVGVPRFDRVQINLSNGRKFTIVARNLTSENRFVKSVTLNGKPLKEMKLTHREIVSGGSLEFEMTKGINPYLQ